MKIVKALWDIIPLTGQILLLAVAAEIAWIWLVFILFLFVPKDSWSSVPLVVTAIIVGITIMATAIGMAVYFEENA